MELVLHLSFPYVMCCQEILIDHIQCGMKVKVEIFEFEYHCFLSGANPVCLVELADWVQTITPNVYFNIYREHMMG